MRWQHKLAISAALVVSGCTTAIPVVRDVDMALSGAMGGHLYPPSHFGEADLSAVTFKHVDPQAVGTSCNLFGNFMDMFVAECVRTFEDGSILVVLPEPQKVSAYYYDTSRGHALGHVYQAQNGLEMDHRGWGRFS
jgi:hypothetical protein